VTALFVFAHQDDEIAAASRIRYEHERGQSIVCVFLTDGGGGRAAPETRNGESASVLSTLSVETVHFLGTSLPIPDGRLPDHLDVALQRLEEIVIAADTVYCLAWEGGHQDHDASQLVAAAFARRRGILDRCFELPLYHGAGLPGPLFRAMSPLPHRQEWTLRRLTFREGLQISMLARRYPSQRASWIGLFPETFLKLAILRREWVRPVGIERYKRRPHERSLLYERRFGFSYERFAEAVAPFVRRYLS
jgi:LmbE family N-acetylglucosaminyl deacetylase